jgi:hypothetical protein
MQVANGQLWNDSKGSKSRFFLFFKIKITAICCICTRRSLVNLNGLTGLGGLYVSSVSK